MIVIVKLSLVTNCRPTLKLAKKNSPYQFRRTSVFMPPQCEKMNSNFLVLLVSPRLFKLAMQTAEVNDKRQANLHAIRDKLSSSQNT